jgi:flagellar assembly protein FliH
MHAEAALSEVRRQAFAEGRQAGEQQARGEMEPILARLSAGLGEIAELRSNLRLRAERDVVSLAILIARRVLHREIGVDQDALTAIARVAFDRLARADSYRVRVHPRFADAIRAALPASTRGHVEIIPDSNCALGALIIQTPEGSIDASIDTQLAEIERGLADRLQVSKR